MVWTGHVECPCPGPRCGGILAKKSLFWMTSVRLQDGKWLLGTALVVGLLVRAVVLAQTVNLGTPIIDEQHYAQLARSLLNGEGFAWAPGQPTSIRPPLYPAFLASIWSIFGQGNYQAVRVAQVLLSVATAWLVFLLGRQVFSAVVGRVSAAAVWLYPSLIFFNVTILTETLYTFLLVAFLLLMVKLVEAPRATIAAGAGLALGLSCLTRSSLWPLPLVLCPLMLAIVRGRFQQRAMAATLMLAGYAVVVAPWAVRNTRLQGVVTVVDTMGGLNLRMGNYEHTPEDRMWAAVELTGERSSIDGISADFPDRPPTEGEKERWAQRKAVEYIIANPGTTMRRSMIRFADFWGLEREYAAGIGHGLYTPSAWFGMTASVAVVIAFATLAVGGVAGVWLAPPRSWRTQVVLLLPAIAIMGVHTLVFGHSRYHVPLVPLLSLYAAALWSEGLVRLSARRLVFAGAAASVAVLAFVWSRQLFVTEVARIQGFFAHVR